MSDSNSEYTLDAFHRELRALCLKPHTEMPNELIYHYTSAEGLIGILETGSIWATNLPSLEDPNEIRLPHETCKEYFFQSSDAGEPNRSQLLHGCRVVFDHVSDMLFPYESQFSASFSLERDSPSQWQEYADQGRGFALGFDSDSMMKLFRSQCPDPDSNTVPYSTIWKMLYDTKSQTAVLDSLVEHTLSKWPELGRLVSPDEHSAECHVATRVVQYAALASASFKADNFSKEREIRAMYANALELQLSGTHLDSKFRTRNGELVRYRELELRYADGMMPLRRIVIGPANEPNRTRANLIQLLSQFGLLSDARPELLDSKCQPWRSRIGRGCAWPFFPT